MPHLSLWQPHHSGWDRRRGTVEQRWQPIDLVAASYLTHGNVLVNGLGGPAGFGANALAVGDDNSSSAIDITSVFGPQGINFFGHNYTSLYINNNGNITFAAPTGQFTPSQITAGANNPIIAPFWADVDTRAGRELERGQPPARTGLLQSR
jgi:hypothetical protein